MRRMLHLRMKNPVSGALSHHVPFSDLHPEFPLKLKIENRTSHDSQACARHRLAATKAVTVEMDYDARSKVFVTFVNELHGMSTF